MMGTNYYLIYGKEEKCEHCGTVLKPIEELHIGKSSAGWAFALRVYPDKDISGLEDWMKTFCRADVEIHDEYGRTISPENMLSVITERQLDWQVPLLRHETYGEQRCVSPPGVDYDLMFYEFS